MAKSTIKLTKYMDAGKLVVDLNQRVIGELIVVIRKEAKKLAPVSNLPTAGTLRNSITGAVISKTTGFVRADAFYAGWVEFGTKNEDGSTRMVAQPYLRPAIAFGKSKIPSIVNRISP